MSRAEQRRRDKADKKDRKRAEVENSYMANTKQKERVKRLRQEGFTIKRKRVKYSMEQQSLF